MASKRQSDPDHKAQSRAIAKRDNNEIIVPIVAQPDYQVKEADEALRASQTASWDTSSELKILRFFLAKAAQDGNALFAVQLTKAIDTMIARNQVTALKCGAYLSREAIRDYIRVIQTIAAESIESRVSVEVFEQIIDDIRLRLDRYFDPAAIAAANERYER